MTLITPLTGKMLIGADAVAGTDGGQRAFNPATNTEIAEPHFGFGTPGDVDRAARLALGLTAERLARPLPVADLIGGAPGDLDTAERGVLQRALARSGGNASAAARSLGIGRATLYRKLERLGLQARG